MAVFTQNTETWARCDKCSFTEFAGFNATSDEVRSLERLGWKFGKRILCPYCAKKEDGKT